MTAAARALALLSAVVALGAGRAALSEEQAVTAVWERVPTAEDMAAIMPPPRPCAGMAAGGSALVECRLAEGGGLEQCRIVREAARRLRLWRDGAEGDAVLPRPREPARRAADPPGHDGVSAHGVPARAAGSRPAAGAVAGQRPPLRVRSTPVQMRSWPTK
ncbi:MAG: hypothetical protein ACOY4K_04100 [Pseudomonadota bacterium]